MLADSDWVEDDTAFRWAAKRMTEKSRQHSAEVTSFEQVYLAECAGIVDASAQEIALAVLRGLGCRSTPRQDVPPKRSEGEPAEDAASARPRLADSLA
jgi:hypothetical protein